MAIAARRPAPPPPTRSTSWSATTGSSLTPELLVHQHSTAVVHDLPVDAAVVVLLAMALAAAGEQHVLGDQPLQVLGRRPLAVVRMFARREQGVEARDGGGHGVPPGPKSVLHSAP